MCLDHGCLFICSFLDHEVAVTERMKNMYKLYSIQVKLECASVDKTWFSLWGKKGQLINNHFRRKKIIHWQIATFTLLDILCSYMLQHCVLIICGGMYIEPSMVHLRSDFPSDCSVSLLFLYCSFVFFIYLYHWHMWDF